MALGSLPFSRRILPPVEPAALFIRSNSIEVMTLGKRP